MGAVHVVLNLTQHKKVFISRPSPAPKREAKTNSRPVVYPACPSPLPGEIMHGEGFAKQVAGQFSFLGLQRGVYQTVSEVF